jgi:hypothetical protein
LPPSQSQPKIASFLQSQQDKVYYSFKCDDTIYMCGGVTIEQVCVTEGSNVYIAGTVDQCRGMIQATTSPNPFTYLCPNNKLMTNFVVYGCKGGKGTRFLPGDKKEECTCPSGNCGIVGGCGGGGVKGGTLSTSVVSQISMFS